MTESLENTAEAKAHEIADYGHHAICYRDRPQRDKLPGPATDKVAVVRNNKKTESTEKSLLFPRNRSQPEKKARTLGKNCIDTAKIRDGK